MKDSLEQMMWQGAKAELGLAIALSDLQCLAPGKCFPFRGLNAPVLALAEVERVLEQIGSLRKGGEGLSGRCVWGDMYCWKTAAAQLQEPAAVAAGVQVVLAPPVLAAPVVAAEAAAASDAAGTPYAGNIPGYPEEP